jgi:hypothetical protein
LDDEVVGTLTLRVDTGDGLSADKNFKEELDLFRGVPEANICELTRFAFSPDVRSQAAIATLFHAIYLYGSARSDCTDLFIEVHPRHLRFYEAMLGFRQVGSPRENAPSNPIPGSVHLMRLPVSEVRLHIDQHRGVSLERARSLYPFFMSAQEEWEVSSRVATADEAECPRTAEVLFHGWTYRLAA